METGMKIFTLVLVLSALSVLAPAKAAATAIWLGDNEIKDQLGGRTIEGRYASGRAFTETYLANGRVEYLEKGASIGGHWSVIAGTLCTIYDTDPAGGCFRVSKAGKNCFEFYFVTRTEDAAPGADNAKPAWTARGAVSGEATACQDGASV